MLWDEQANILGYVRVEVVQAKDLSDALSKGTRFPGENLMNSHYVKRAKQRA